MVLDSFILNHVQKSKNIRFFRHIGGSSESLDFTGIAQNKFCEISVG